MLRITLGYLGALYFAIVAIILAEFLYGIRGDMIGMSAFVCVNIIIQITIIQSAVIIVISEYIPLRHPAYYIVCGIINGVVAVEVVLFGIRFLGVLVLQMATIGGAVGGYVYWLIAGRYAIPSQNLT